MILLFMAIVGAGALVAAVVGLHTAETLPSVCPKCGGDLVEWSDVFERSFVGEPERYDWRGCPKVRDHGAGSPATDDWTKHYARVLRRRPADLEDRVK